MANSAVDLVADSDDMRQFAPSLGDSATASSRPVSRGRPEQRHIEKDAMRGHRSAVDLGSSEARSLTTATAQAHRSGGTPSSNDAKNHAMVAELAELGRRVDMHSRRLTLFGSWAQRWRIRHASAARRERVLRSVLCEWRACSGDDSVRPQLVLLTKRSDDHASNLLELQQSIVEVDVRVDAHERRLATLDAIAQKQEQQLEKVDAALHVLCNNGAAAVPAEATPLPGNGDDANAAKLDELVEALGGQARAVDDLGAIVRQELATARGLLEAEAANASAMPAPAFPDPPADVVMQQLLECVAQQGRSMEELHSMVQQLVSEPPPHSPERGLPRDDRGSPTPGAKGEPAAELAAAVPEITIRVVELEESVATMQRHLGLLAALVRQVRDHAADALEDRVAAAISEVHRRLKAPLAEARDRARQLRTCGDSVESADEMSGERPAGFRAESSVSQPGTRNYSSVSQPDRYTS